MKTITIGRSSRCDIILSHVNISRIHAKISVINGQYVYYDRSRNGSSIGGQIISNRRVTLAPGTPVLLANKIPLPWNRVYALLPASDYRVNEAETHFRHQAATYDCPPDSRQYRRSASEDRLGIGWGVLAFFIPLAGWIMYFAWKDETPVRANAAGIIGAVSFVLSIIVSIS